MTNAVIAIVVILLMIVGCYLISGISIVVGTIFERKKPVEKK